MNLKMLKIKFEALNNILTHYRLANILCLYNDNDERVSKEKKRLSDFHVPYVIAIDTLYSRYTYIYVHYKYTFNFLKIST